MRRLRSCSARIPCCLALVAAIAPLPSPAADVHKPAATRPAPPPTAFDTPLAAADLDPATFAHWVDGVEKPVEAKGVLERVWTQSAPTGIHQLTFGEGKKPGPRHLRIGFRKPVTIGSILVRGGGSVSVLRPDASLPGALAEEAAWIPADRLAGGRVGRTEVDPEGYALWVLPQATATRAIRFTHVAEAADADYGGSLGAVYVLNQRWANFAPQATATASHNPQRAGLVINDSNDRTWPTWDNWEEAVPPEVVSPEHPEVITLVWSQPVTLRGVNLLWAGFAAAEVQTFRGPAEEHPIEAPADAWQTVAASDHIQHYYPRPLGVNWLDFGREVTTRALRLRITQATSPGSPGGHLFSKTKDGRRVWLGELQAVGPLAEAPLACAKLIAKRDELHPPIPVRFTLPAPGYVTLVIEDAQGNRVRNLIADTFFAAGPQVAWWDGLDDLGRDHEAARHGVYHIPGQFVAPGTYQARGLVHGNIDLRYEFAVYNEGRPPWDTEDKTGCWMTNHTPPTAAAFVPGTKTADGKPLVYLGAYVSEGGHGLQWIDPDGTKRGGIGWVGGAWTGAPTLAVDLGPKAATGVQAYVGSAWEGELRLTAVLGKGFQPVATLKLGNDGRGVTAPRLEGFDGGDKTFVLGGIAAYDRTLVVSLARQGSLLFINAQDGTQRGDALIPDPRGVACDRQGRLLVLSGTNLLRFPTGSEWLHFHRGDKAETIASGLEDPRHVTVDGTGQIYISDRGASHQVKVFSREGKLLRTVGRAGRPQAGKYDPLHMNNPNGIAVDDRGRLWVAEADTQPKRVSLWSPEGNLLRAWYGPGRYGGGGKLDPLHKEFFYYDGMRFHLDWQRGTFALETVFYRPEPDDLTLPSSHHADGKPEEPFYVDGRRYFTNCYNSSPTNGTPLAFLWLERNGTAQPVAACGRAQEWDVLRTPDFARCWPKGLDPKGDRWKNQALALWTDRNGDARAQPDEVTILPAQTGGVTVMPDAAFVVCRVDGKTMRYVPKAFSDRGVPSYDLAAGEVLAVDVQPPMSSGGDQALVHPDGWTVVTSAPKPFDRASLCGVYRGQPRWSYPSVWPGLHASHEAPTPDEPGEVIGTTRLLGGFIRPPGDAGPLWLVNGNMGPMYVFTADGLFVHQLFADVRTGRPWKMAAAERGMLLNDVAPHDENFWPSVTQTADGNVYLVDGARSSLVRIDGLDSIRRLPAMPLSITADDLRAAQAYQLSREAARQKTRGLEPLRVTIRRDPPVVDGRLDDWKAAAWATIDQRGVRANFNSNSMPYDVHAAVAIAHGRLFAAFRTGDPRLLQNSGEVPTALFKTGGALDLMLGTNPAADPKRTTPAAGDVRLLVTRVAGKTRALLYRAVAPGVAADARVGFSSPWRTIYFDRVDDVSRDVQLANVEGDYELSVPLATLGWSVEPGRTLQADVGLLRGDGTQTTQRVYWANKATGITADVPSEAELTPGLWGRWILARE